MNGGKISHLSEHEGLLEGKVMRLAEKAARRFPVLLTAVFSSVSALAATPESPCSIEAFIEETSGYLVFSVRNRDVKPLPLHLATLDDPEDLFIAWASSSMEPEKERQLLRPPIRSPKSIREISGHPRPSEQRWVNLRQEEGLAARVPLAQSGIWIEFGRGPFDLFEVEPSVAVRTSDDGGSPRILEGPHPSQSIRFDSAAATRWGKMGQEPPSPHPWTVSLHLLPASGRIVLAVWSNAPGLARLHLRSVEQVLDAIQAIPFDAQGRRINIPAPLAPSPPAHPDKNISHRTAVLSRDQAVVSACRLWDLPGAGLWFSEGLPGMAKLEFRPAPKLFLSDEQGNDVPYEGKYEIRPLILNEEGRQELAKAIKRFRPQKM
jgi:hypothetical protein